MNRDLSGTTSDWRPAQAVLFLNETGTVIGVSEALARLLQRAAGELVGSAVSGIFPDFAGNVWDSRAGEARRAGRWRGVSSVHEAEVWLALMALAGRDGAISFMLAVEPGEDLAHQVAPLVLYSPHPMLQVGFDGRLRFANDAAEPVLRHFSLQKGELISPAFQAFVDECVAAGEQAKVDRTFDGETYAFTAKVLPDARIIDVCALDVTDHKQVETRLAASREALHNLIETDTDGVLVVDGQGTIRFANSASSLLLGRETGQLIDTPLGLPLVLRHTAEVTVPRDGELHYAEMRTEQVMWDGEPAQLVMLHDVTDRRRREQLLRRRNRTLAVMSAGNHALVRAEDENALQQQYCDILVNIGKFRFAWIGHAADEAAESIIPHAWCGQDGGFLSATASYRQQEAPGPTALAAREQRTAVVLDLSRAADAEPWRKEAVRHGFESTIALPLFDHRGVFGVLSIYSGVPDAFDEEEVALLEELADDLAYGVRSLRDRSARREAEQLLRLRNLAVEVSRNGVMVVDAQNPEWPLVHVNPAFATITGYSADEALGRNPRFLAGEQVKQPAMETLRRLLEARQSGTVLLRNFRKDGTAFWNELYVAPLYDDTGRLTHYVGIINDRTEQKEYERQLEYRSTHDALTRLPNRNLMVDRLTQAVAASERYGRSVAVMLLDIDNFKVINESLGHRIGDLLLQETASRLQARAGDAVGRHSGDEYMIILPDIKDPKDVALFAERMVDAFSEPFFIEGREIRVTVSIGVSLAPRDGRDSEALLKYADAAMFRAKELGRNTYQFFTEQLNRRVLARLDMEANLRTALKRNEFFLCYQPQVDLRNGQIIGVEALIRWRHPKFGIVLPNRFIPLAEETGLIVSIGAWVLRQACEQTRVWERETGRAIAVSVNLSARQITGSDVVATVEDMLKSTGLQPDRLELELTENAVMGDVSTMREQVEGLKRLGVKVAVDDFGTGYSSLGRLREFAFDRLKLDISFVRNITTEPDAAAIALAIVAMSHTLHLAIIAEGVETEAQLRYLQRNGCDQVQGFYLSRPVEAHVIRRMLERTGFDQVTRIPVERRGTLLVVDDEPNVVDALERLLHNQYRVLTTDSLNTAFDLLATHAVQVVISSEHMSQMRGREFLSRVRELYPGTVRIALSGYGDLASLKEALQHGRVDKVIEEPWDNERVLDLVAEAFREYEQGRGVSRPTMH